MIKPLHIIVIKKNIFVHQILSAYLRKNLLILEMLLNIFFLQFIYTESTFKGYKYFLHGRQKSRHKKNS